MQGEGMQCTCGELARNAKPGEVRTCDVCLGVYDPLDQPPPAPEDASKPAVWDLVQADMRERDRVGRARYGTPLQPHNGRDALKDAYAEALDLVVYLRQEIEERAGVTIHDFLKRSVLEAEAEYDREKNYEAAQLLVAMRQAQQAAEVYECWKTAKRVAK